MGAAPPLRSEALFVGQEIWQSEYITVNPAPFLTKAKMRFEWDEERAGLHLTVLIYVFVFGDEEIIQEDYFFSESKFADFGDGRLRVDLQVDQVLDTFYGQGSVDGQNDNNICGFSDWSVGVPKDVTGRDCSFPEDGPGFSLTPENGAAAHLLLEKSGDQLKVLEWVMAESTNRILDWPTIPILLPVVEGWE
jgi:hypothetical protein